MKSPFFCIRYVIELVLFELFNFSGNKYRWKNTWTVALFGKWQA